MIFLVTANGLGNRLRTIGSLQNLAQRTGQKLCVIWTKEYDLNARFSDLFEKQQDFSVWNLTVSKWFRNILCHYFLYSRRSKIFRALVVNGCYIQSHSETEMVEDLNKHKLIFVRTCYEFTKEYSLDSFRFNDDVKSRSLVRKELDDATEEENLIGVHIRRGDHVVSSEYSSSQMFEDYIENVRDKNTSTRFYIASDSVEEKENMKSKFGDSIIIQPVSSYARDTKEGIVESAVELYNLSCCSQIIGSFTSTFSEMAAKLGHSILKILVDEKKPPVQDWDCTRHRVPLVHLNKKEWAKYYFDYIPVVLGFKKHGSFVL